MSPCPANPCAAENPAATTKKQFTNLMNHPSPGLIALFLAKVPKTILGPWAEACIPGPLHNDISPDHPEQERES